ncbi:MAG TPA: hypothetical protein PLN96_01180 [Zoogloea sp.]|uniref:beta strand repeat-containing protein n=1 Tax=Zoogloea sp. TaxID=49181 RepID=UPI002C8EB8E5|nr:hypothetical protein [Zoogloea sp.]HMV62027.1 hypothetical protein [Rhodocyclaceae bacterium]HMY48714.1 hypothetical protein [Rhodocyclaceae bacterium]HND23785.1 hypothetical protein [Rhodocyclaceae bacterium]HNI46447.1 hypothetical protein [Zoogloea sp.]HNO86700.1 hypothetical protein [Rhodocyclaceae bacterium]
MEHLMHQSILRTFLSWALLGVLGVVMSLLAGCGGGGGGGGCGFIGCSSSSGSSGSTGGTVTVSIVDGTGTAITALPTSGSVTVQASVKNASGSAVANAVVTFATDSAYGTLNPTTGTALTNSSGVAMIQLSAASLTAGGAATVTATATLDSVSVSGSANYTVSAANYAVAVGIYDSTGGTATTTLPSSGSVTVKATVTNASGVAIPNINIKFTTDSALALFNPSVGTAMTNSAGVASVQMSSAGLTASGAGQVTATITDATKPAVAGYASYQVGAANVTLSAMNISATSIPAYGTSTVAVTVNVNGTPTTTPVTVAFSSGCATSGKASIASSVLTVNGIATATYTDKGCNGTDTITATVLDKTVQGSITSAGPQPANIQFVSATPSSIALKGTAGLIDISNVTFKVVDASGNAVPATTVEFYLTNWTGGIKLDDNTQTQVDALTGGKVRKQTAADGTVVVAVQAGTNPTSVWVLANVLNSSLSTQSSKLVISTGLPSQDRFSLAVGTHNIEGWRYDGVTTPLTVYAFDRVGNPIPDGSTINFVTEGAGASPGTCSVGSGSCSTQFVSSESRPRNEGVGVCLNSSGAMVPSTNSGAVANTCAYSGRVAVLAYANGEESFDDANGNNLYDSGENFRDVGDIYVDNNEDGVWESPEQYFPFAGSSGNTSTGAACSTTYSGYATAKSKANTCNGKWGQAQVRRDQVVVLSDSYVSNIYAITSNTTVSGGGVVVTDGFNFSSGAACGASYTIRIADLNNNPLPAGTTVAISNINVTYSQVGTTDPVTVDTDISGSIILDTIAPGGTYHSITMLGKKCLTIPSGTMIIKTTSPKGLTTSIPVQVN